MNRLEWSSAAQVPGYFLPPAESDGLEEMPETLERETSPDRCGNLLVRTTHQLDEMPRLLVPQLNVHVIVAPLQS